MCTSTSLISQSHFTTKTMSERRNELSKSRWVPPTTTKESRLSPLCLSNMNDTSTEKKRKAYSDAWVSMDTWNRTNSDQSSVGTLNIRSNFGSPYMKGRETIKQLIHLASSHGDLLSTKHLSCILVSFPSAVEQHLLDYNSPQQKHEQQLKNDLHRIPYHYHQKVKQI